MTSQSDMDVCWHIKAATCHKVKKTSTKNHQ